MKMVTEKLDLLIVTDEGDFLRKQALRMIYALHNVYPDYTAEVRRFSDHRYIPELINFSSKKLVFLTWGYDSYQKLYTTRFLKSSTVRSNNDRLMLTLVKDLDGKPIDILDVHFDEFNDKNRMTVNNIRLVDTWWPQMVTFLFDIPASQLCKPVLEYHTRTISEGDKPVKCVDVVNTCMDFFHVKISSQPVPEYRGCNVVFCQGEFPQAEAENCVYISDSYLATETTPYQYNKEHWLAGLLRIYSKTGVVKAPLRERLLDFSRRGLDSCKTGLLCGARPCWDECKAGFNILSEAKMFVSVAMIIVLSNALCVFGTGLPYWRGLIIQDGSSRKEYILYGLFKRCFHRGGYSAYLEDCATHNFDMPGWWILLIALCFLVMVLHQVALTLLTFEKDYGERNTFTDIGTVCYLIIGLLCIVILIIWGMLSEDFICSIENCDKAVTNQLHASFYLYVVMVIFYPLWITGAVIYHYYLLYRGY